MNNQILSLNISNLKTFIKSQNFTDNKLIISFKYIIPNILFHFINQNLNNLSKIVIFEFNLIFLFSVLLFSIILKSTLLLS